MPTARTQRCFRIVPPLREQGRRAGFSHGEKSLSHFSSSQHVLISPKTAILGVRSGQSTSRFQTFRKWENSLARSSKFEFAVRRRGTTRFVLNDHIRERERERVVLLWFSCFSLVWCCGESSRKSESRQDDLSLGWNICDRRNFPANGDISHRLRIFDAGKALKIVIEGSSVKCEYVRTTPGIVGGLSNFITGHAARFSGNADGLTNNFSFEFFVWKVIVWLVPKAGRL